MSSDHLQTDTMCCRSDSEFFVLSNVITDNINCVCVREINQSQFTDRHVLTNFSCWRVTPRQTLTFDTPVDRTRQSGGNAPKQINWNRVCVLFHRVDFLKTATPTLIFVFNRQFLLRWQVATRSRITKRSTGNGYSKIKNRKIRLIIRFVWQPRIFSEQVDVFKRKWKPKENRKSST